MQYQCILQFMQIKLHTEYFDTSLFSHVSQLCLHTTCELICDTSSTHERMTALYVLNTYWSKVMSFSSSRLLGILMSYKQHVFPICHSKALKQRQITTPAPHYSVFYRPDALPAVQPESKHWRDDKLTQDEKKLKLAYWRLCPSSLLLSSSSWPRPPSLLQSKHQLSCNFNSVYHLTHYATRTGSSDSAVCKHWRL